MTDDDLAVKGWPPRRVGKTRKPRAVTRKLIGLVGDDVFGGERFESRAEKQLLRVAVRLKRCVGIGRHTDPRVVHMSYPLDLLPAVNLPTDHDPIASHTQPHTELRRSEADVAVVPTANSNAQASTGTHGR